MKHHVLIISICSVFTLIAQAQNEITKTPFDHLRPDAIVLTSEGLISGKGNVKDFVSDFKKTNGKSCTYKKNFGIEVNAKLDYEIGEIKGDDSAYSVMFLKGKGDSSGPKIEFLVIHKKTESKDPSSALNSQRARWMELCNAHQAAKLVKELYTPNAYYYNRGRLLEGTNAISSEYGYMNSAGYSLKLTPKHVTFVSSEIAYEIGRCSGSYPLPYMLLWQKQANGNWQILMDSNY